MMSLIICRVDDTGGFCVLQSDMSTEHLSVFGLSKKVINTVVAKHRLLSSLYFPEESLLNLH